MLEAGYAVTSELPVSTQLFWNNLFFIWVCELCNAQLVASISLWGVGGEVTCLIGILSMMLSIYSLTAQLLAGVYLT